jgi:hypothetical protein
MLVPNRSAAPYSDSKNGGSVSTNCMDYPADVE